CASTASSPWYFDVW
nr:immunoglobulin heavy chain junction region [Mus musculus]